MALNKAIQQNSELRAKLNNIHVTSDTSNFPDPVRMVCYILINFNNYYLLILGFKFIFII